MVERSFKTIHPGDEDWFLDGVDLGIFAQAAVSSDGCVFAATLHGGDYDYYDACDPCTRLYRYRAGTWQCFEIPERIAGIVPYREEGWTENGIAVLTEEGQLWVLGQRAFRESIGHERARLLSVLYDFGGRLTAVGHDGQVYVRTGRGWAPDDEGLYGAEPQVPRPRRGDKGTGSLSITAMAVAPDGRDAYAAGSAYLARPALFWRPGDGRWAWLGLDPADASLDYIALNALHAESDAEIWISTDQGYLLRGNGRDGFRRATEIARRGDGTPLSLSNVVDFEGRRYVGGTSLCLLSPDGRLEQQQAPPCPVMGSPGEVGTTIGGRLGVVDGVLWAMGYGVLSRFDGRSWDRVVMPSVYRYAED